MAAKKSSTTNSKLIKIAPGVYSDDPRDLREAREWSRREPAQRPKKRD
jgi:hypothetical protein